MKLSGKQKVGITLGTVVTVAIAIPLTVHLVKRYRAKHGFKEQDAEYNPAKDVMYAYVGEQGSANIRTEPQIKGSFTQAYETTSFWDWLTDPVSVAAQNVDNKIGTVMSGRIGKVMKTVTGKDGHIWYQVKLDTPLQGIPTGWVRKDVVRIQIVPK